MIWKLADLLKSSGCDVPEWIFSIDKKNKKFYKKMIKKPILRESIDKNKKIKKDKKFH